MLTKSHLTIATALAVAAIAAPAATAMPADPVDAQDVRSYPTLADPRTGPPQGDLHAGTVTPSDARGEHAASLADRPAEADLRTPDAVEPFVRPVVVEVGEPVSSPGFDWTAAIIGIAGGLALAVLAAAAISGGRRRQGRPSTV
jgi:hypothetical protein